MNGVIAFIILFQMSTAAASQAGDDEQKRYVLKSAYSSYRSDVVKNSFTIEIEGQEFDLEIPHSVGLTGSAVKNIDERFSKMRLLRRYLEENFCIVERLDGGLPYLWNYGILREFEAPEVTTVSYSFDTYVRGRKTDTTRAFYSCSP